MTADSIDIGAVKMQKLDGPAMPDPLSQSVFGSANKRNKCRMGQSDFIT